jgi:hypothetical protein
MRHLFCLALAACVLAACGGPDESSADEADATTPPRNLYTLTNAPVAGAHPAALVYLPKAFDAHGPLNLVVHFHGWSNCITTDGEATARACAKGYAASTAHNYIAQMEATGANAALVLIELHFDQPTSDDGNLAKAGFFKSMILELLPHIGALASRTYAESDLGGIVLTSHSGGYQALAHSLSIGGLTDHVREIILLDSVYGFLPQLEAWEKAALGKNRVAVIYTDGGGTEANAQSMATDARKALAAAGLPASMLLDDRTFATQPETAFAAPLVFKRSSLAHDQTAVYYFSRLLQQAGL